MLGQELRTVRRFATTAAMFVVLLVVAGCGGVRQVDGGGNSDSSLSSSTAPPVTTAVSAATVTSEQSANGQSPDWLQKAFWTLSEAQPGMAIFAPSYLPEGAQLAESWWPLTDVADPTEYSGQPVGNPWVFAEEPVPEIQVLVRVPDGWLMFLQNFRGDVGESPGKAVGEVDGHRASLFEVNGGLLVQWQVDGLWYGVFARGVAEEELVKVAAGMRRLSGRQ